MSISCLFTIKLKITDFKKNLKKMPYKEAVFKKNKTYVLQKRAFDIVASPRGIEPLLPR